MEDGRIKDHQVSGSNTYGDHYPSRGRLNNKTKKDSKTQNKTRWGAWCSDINDQNQYLQVSWSILLLLYSFSFGRLFWNEKDANDTYSYRQLG